MATETTLGAQLSIALTNITELIVKTKSDSQRQQLLDQQRAIAGDLQTFIDKVVDATLPEYQEATNALIEANQAAEAAKRQLDKIAETITKFASAADKVAQLAKKVAAA